MDARDRDFAIRTIIGEAGAEEDVGKLAVAHAILNRVRSGKWGKTATEVVFSPKQFEPWSTRAAELMMIDKASPDYKRAGLILDMALTGMAPDPTGGATHFYAPKAQAALGRKPPKWAKGDGLPIGGHLFFADPDADPPQTGQDAIAAVVGDPLRPGSGASALALTADGQGGTSPPAAPAANSPPAIEPGEVFRKWGVSDKPAAAAPAEIDTNAVFSKWGVQPAAAAPAAAPAAAASAVDKELERRNAASFQERIAQPTPAAPADPMASVPGWAERLSRGLVAAPGNIAAGIAGLPGELEAGRAKRVEEGFAAVEQGKREMQEGRSLPRFPSADPSTWEPGGLLRAGGGYLGAGVAPLTSAVHELVEDPITKMTGNPVAGSLAGLMVPVGPVAGKTGKAVAAKIGPETRAVNEIVDLVGKENIPEAIARLEANPRLTLADVSPAARDVVAGLAADARAPKAQKAAVDPLVQRTKTRGAEVTAAFEDLGQVPDTTKVLKDLKQRSIDVGEKAIEPALKGAGPVDITSTIAAIDKEIGPHMVKRLKEGGDTTGITPQQKELWKIRDALRKGAADEQQMFANAKGATKSQKGAHEIQSELRVMAEKLESGTVGSEKLHAVTLREIREKLINAIDDASPRAQRKATPEETLKHHGYTDADIAGTDPQVLANTASMLEKKHGPTPIKEGSYKPALSKYRDAKDVEAAFQKWDGFMHVKKSADDRPEVWRAEVANYSPEQLQAAQQGALTALDTHLKSIRNAAGEGAQIPKLNEAIGERIKILFGEQKGQALLNRLRDEREMAFTDNRTLGNSKTAHVQAAQKRLDIRDPDKRVEPAGIAPLALGIAGDMALGTSGAATATMAGLSMMKGAATKKLRKVGAELDKSRNAKVAELLTSGGGADNPVLAILRSQLPGAGGGNKVGNLLRGAAGVPLLP